MGKAARAACIFTPWALTVASFVCLVLITISGWGSKGTLNELFFFKANFTELDIMAPNLPSDELTAALKLSAESNQLARVYEVHLWNFCERNTVDPVVTYCAPKMKDYHFDPITTWHLDSADGNVTEDEENKLLGKTASKALDTYRSAAQWMYIAYVISFWASFATILCGIFAIFSRIGSFFTWLFSIVSSLFTLAAVVSSTIIFSAFVGAMNEILNPYKVHLSIGMQALALVWLAVLFSWAGTLFWLFSACCCSGRNNPHHSSNKRGLWYSEPSDYGRSTRGLRVFKTGSAYERVLPDDQTPLTETKTEYGGGRHSREPSGKFEPLRHRQSA